MTDRRLIGRTLAINQAEVYSAIAKYIVEIYDKSENYLDDVALIKSLIENTETIMIMTSNIRDIASRKAALAEELVNRRLS